MLFCSDTYRPYVSGGVTSMDVYASELRALGHRVTIVAPGYPGAADEPHVVRLPSLPLPAYPNLRLIAPVSHRARRQLQALAPDIVHVHTPFAVGLLGLSLSRTVRRPLVFTCHSFYEEYTRYLAPLSGPLRGVIRRYLLAYCRRCQLVLAPSTHLRRFLREIGTTTPIQVLPTGVRSPLSGPAGPIAPRRGRDARPDDAFVMALVGRLGKEKNLDLALTTLAELAGQAAPDRGRWRLLVIGGGPQAEPMRRLAVKLGVGDLVTFAGEIPRQQVFERLRLADLMIFTSVIETQGLVMLEAMANGLPVVAADSPVARELIRDGIEGRVVPGEPRQMAIAVRGIADDPARAAQMGAEAWGRSREYDPAVLARRLTAYYRELLGRVAAEE